MNNREIRWQANKFLFEVELEKLLSHCPNMAGEDDMRDLCEGRCPAYHWCISIEPTESEFDLINEEDDLYGNSDEGAPLPSTPTPTCPECGSTDIRIVYKDDEATEIDFYDCLMCRTIWYPKGVN